MTVNGLRRRSREMALQLLFQSEFVAEYAAGEFRSTMAKEFLERFKEDFAIEPDVAEYGEALFLGIVERIAEIDSIIQAHSTHWKVTRMGLVDRSVMRIAIYEMKFLDLPLTPGIAIDEAVEIAKLYGSTESSAFVNGILDHVARGL